METKTQDLPKKCFCVRCFLPIDENDKVEIDGQNFHKMCGTCCICRTIPAKLKMFYGHVFCEECFKTFVLSRFRGECPQMHADSWWMQFAPGVKAHGTSSEAGGQQKPKPDAKPDPKPEEPPASDAKRCICARCLQAVDDADKVEIGGQTFHCCCARCCSCHQVPKDNIKIYCGQVFCEACFHQHILSRNRDNPTEFFKSCFEQWKVQTNAGPLPSTLGPLATLLNTGPIQTGMAAADSGGQRPAASNPQFAENMKMFMESSASAHSPLVFMAPPPSYRVNPEREGVESKSATPASLNSWDLSIENRTEVSYPESHSTKTSSVAAAEKIEKLTKYLRETSNLNMETPKKWKSIRDTSLAQIEPAVPLPRQIVSSQSRCPKCLWQSGTIYVDRD